MQMFTQFNSLSPNNNLPHRLSLPPRPIALGQTGAPEAEEEAVRMLKLIKKRSGEVKTPKSGAAQQQQQLTSATAQVVERMAPPSKLAPAPTKETAAAASGVDAKGAKAVAAADATKRPTKKLESLQALRYITALQVSQPLIEIRWMDEWTG